ncbi:MAG: UvrD-helicase domain-containing protein [Planctomycetota bacterium]
MNNKKMKNKDILNALNTPQIEAVTYGEGPLLVLAGAGSGKTRVITRRIAYLLSRGIPPYNIVAVTFTNKAAREMLSRIETLTYPGISRKLNVSTFHSFCARMLRIYAEKLGYTRSFTIAAEKDSLRLIKLVLDNLKLSSTVFKPAWLSDVFSKIKNSLKTPEEYAEAELLPHPQHISAAFDKYQEYLHEQNMMDFDDLLTNFLTLLGKDEEAANQLQEKVKYLLIDEYQDTNITQYGIARLLVAKNQNITATGDPDQSIYGWRGAEISNILEFEADFSNAKIVRLEENYRSTTHILKCAQMLVENNRLRIEKTLFTNNPEGEKVKKIFCRDETNEAAFISSAIKELVSKGVAFSDIAVLYRVNALSRNIEDTLREKKIPYHIVAGVEFYSRKEIKDLLAYLSLLTNPASDVSLIRIINTPPREIGNTTVQRLKEFASGKISLLQAVKEVDKIETLSKRSTQKVKAFAELYNSLLAILSKPPGMAVKELITKLKYEEYLQGEEDSKERIENVRELVNAATQFEKNHNEADISEFLQDIALVADSDDYDKSVNRISLMTLHAAKGLEFPVVFICGVEDGIIPHERSVTSRSVREYEEERRLLFVGMTRAEKMLYLTYCRFRSQYGQTGFREPSPFMDELPRDVQFFYLADEDLTKENCER